MYLNPAIQALVKAASDSPEWSLALDKH